MGRLTIKIVIALCMLCNNVLCQISKETFNTLKTSIPQEKVELHTNANILLAGETLFYKLYCLNSLERPSTVSKIAYVELIGVEKNQLFKHKLKLVGGLANGDFFIPSNIETGNYKIVAYTKWMNNNESNPFYQTDVYIINPFIPKEFFLENKKIFDENQIDIEIKKGDLIIGKKSNGDIKLETNNKSYKTREKVELTFNNVLEEKGYGNYSLSIRKLDSLEVTKKKSNRIINKVHRENYLPEILGEIISGQVIAKDDNINVADKIVSLSIPGTNYVYKNVKTDKAGKFHFNISENYNNSDAILQVLDKNNERYDILLDDLSFNFFNQLKYSRVILNENIKDWMLTKSIHNQIESASHNLKRDSVIYKKPAKLFYGKPSVKYVLDDYKRFPTVKETFVEVVEEAAVRKYNDTFNFKVFNYEELRNNVFRDYEPLVLFDGNLIQNNSDVLDYNSNKIESISVVRGIYFYGPSIFNGIIDIKTKKGDFNLPKNRNDLNFISLDAVKENKIYFNPNYKTQFEDLKRIPDYRNQLLWIPDLTLDFNLKTLKFYTSDATGIFEILLQGYSLDGKYLKSKEYIEIKKD
ncbi:hypothetical protein [Thalassobellus citreus]|uniref:hypothetical protein n=1 Tax=Thalassobellus citreus TaxID=3367752 RepID=UPI00378BE34C